MTSTLDAITKLEKHGMKFISSKTQLKNGTYVFQDLLDPYSDTLYGMFLPSGYVRKMGRKSMYCDTRRWYQLNPTKTGKHKYGTCKERILLPNNIDKMLEIIIRVSNKARK